MKQISDKVWMVDPPSRNFPFSTSIFIRDDVRGLIDSSTSLEDREYLMKQDIQVLLGSHGHVDHALNNSAYPGASLLMNPRDHGYVASRESFLRMLGSELVGPHHFQGMKIDRMDYKFRPADGSLENAQKISFGRTEVEVLYLPGHTPGHTGYIFPREGFIFTADIDLEPFGPWYGNLWSSVDDFLESIELIRRLKPDMLITGHGPEPITEGIDARLDRFRDVIFQREQEIVRLIGRGKNTLQELTAEGPVFKGHPKSIILFEWMMIRHHLERLVRLGRVTSEKDRFYLVSGVRASNLNLG